METKRLTFITSNKVKLSHARYISKAYDVDIIQHKKIYYGVGYNEPRIKNREELLKESIEDAIFRWKKNASEKQLFFIEDTSVVIEALSSDEEEVPGVDVKYWMQNITFEELDAELKSRGNNRNVTVYSHVILFLSSDLQENGKPPYKIFVGKSRGKIVEQEDIFNTNIIYPWLDNKSFNKWFVPEGFSVPISMLKIEDANLVDFRRNSILQMLDFLYNNKVIRQKVDPPFLIELDIKDYYIICGQTCSGKSTAGRYLLQKSGFYHLEASDFMTLRYLETCGTTFNIDKNEFAAQLLAEDPTVVVKLLCKYMENHQINDQFVITGFRNKTEIKAFMKRWNKDYSHIIYLIADSNTRFKRWKLRRRDDILYTKEKFREINKIQIGMGVNKILYTSKSIKKIVNNSSDLNLFYKSIDSLMCENSSVINEIDIHDYTQAKKVKLEDAILVALMTEYSDDKYLSTTEIAHLINNLFPNINKKNKNNISRYFNQAYYPYYEIKNDKNTLKYKLSPTGYSEAYFRIKNRC